MADEERAPSALPPRAGREAVACSAGHPCPHVCVSSVVILDNDTAASGNVKQWVNLPRETDFVDNNVITNTDRLTNSVRFRVSYNRAGSVSAEVRVVPASQAIQNRYSQTEKGRNGNYRYTNSRQSFARDGATGFTEGEVRVHAAGGDQFTIEARCTDCHNAVRSSHNIEVWRRIWLVPIVMEGVRRRVPNLHSFRQVFEGNKIRISERPMREMPSLPTLGSSSDKQQLLDNAYSAYRNSGASNLEPYAVAVLFVDQIANKRELSLRASNFRRGTLTLDVEDASHQTYSLWRNMGPGQTWFISGRFTPNNDVWGDPIDIEQSSITTVASGGNPNDHRQINVNVDRSVFRVLETRFSRAEVPDRAPGTLSLRLNVVDTFLNGYALTHPDSRVNIIVIATRVEWQDRPGEGMIQTIAHELGHKIGMVADGDPVTNVICDLDRVGTWYNQHNHMGPHCSQGIATPLPADIRGQPGICVMYGESGPNRLNSFCADCSEAVKKVDISRGFVPFEPGWGAYLTALFS